MPTSSDEFISPSRAANLLGVSKQTIINYLKAGKLKGERGPLGRVVSLSSVEELAKTRELA